MVWFIIGGVIAVVWMWFRGGSARFVANVQEAQAGTNYPIQGSIFAFIVGAALFGTPLWLLFG